MTTQKPSHSLRLPFIACIFAALFCGIVSPCPAQYYSDASGFASTPSDQIPTQRIDDWSAIDHNTNSLPVTQLASRRTFRSSTRNDLNRRFPTEPALEQLPVEQIRPSYTFEMIQSARLSANQFRMIAENALPTAANIATGNASFADQWADLAETQITLEGRVADATRQLVSMESDFQDINTKLTDYGLTPTIGMLLRHKKEQLNAWQVHDSQTLFASQELQVSRQKQLELEMVQYNGGDPIIQSSEILVEAGYDYSSPENAGLVSQMQSLLTQRGEWIESLQQGYKDYRQKLGELDSATVASSKLTKEFRKLIDRHVTWIRSDDALSVRDVTNLKGGIAALFDSRRSADFGPTIKRKIKSSSSAAVMTLVAFIVILLLRWRLKSWLVGIGCRTKLRDATKETQLLAAGVLTVLVSFAIPSALYVVARWLGTGIVSEATLHASAGFFAASLVALTIELPRQILRTYGYIDRHIDLELPERERAVRYLMVLAFGLVVISYAITVMGALDHGVWRSSVSRFGMFLAMLMVAWTAHRALRPIGGFLEPIIAKYGGTVIHRIRLLIYLVGIGFPIAMIALTALGYGFTATEFLKRAMITLSCCLIAATLWPSVKILAHRGWKLLTGVAPAERQFDEYGEIETASETITGTLGEHSLELKHQLAFLFQCAFVIGAIVSFGWLWIDVFPNVRMGNPIVWTVQDSVTESSVDAAGQTISNTFTESTDVTAMHLLLAAATLFIAFQLAKLLPALFDALVLQRVSFDEGMEHFSLVLGRFLLFGFGCLIACNFVGVRWETIQWLAVGLMIGLGFGLQDMVRNLFGGFIVLFEKPARLGDLITVGKVTGRVAAQKLRTTVVSDDEGREVIIPNKNFVSQDVTNWMGAGRLTVIPLEVAVTREERPADVCRTLYELVIEQPDVLLTPAPQATLVCVGKRSQRIEVRAWIEESKDAKRYRDELLQLVRTHLKGNRLLASQQPSQPEMIDVMDSGFEDSILHGSRRRRKRSA